MVASVPFGREYIMAGNGESYFIEYYASFAGFGLPLNLSQKIEKEMAETGTAAYYRAEFDSGKKLVRVAKIYRGDLLFEHRYLYYPNGKLMRAEIRSNDGEFKVHEFDASGNPKDQ